MRLFGRKRYWERQRQVCDEQYRAGFSFGVYCFQQDCPRPAFCASDDDAEMSWRFGLQAGFNAAEAEYEDEVGFFLHEKGAEIVAGFEDLLRQEAT